MSPQHTPPPLPPRSFAPSVVWTAANVQATVRSHRRPCTDAIKQTQLGIRKRRGGVGKGEWEGGEIGLRFHSCRGERGGGKQTTNSNNFRRSQRHRDTQQQQQQQQPPFWYLAYLPIPTRPSEDVRALPIPCGMKRRSYRHLAHFSYPLTHPLFPTPARPTPPPPPYSTSHSVI